MTKNTPQKNRTILGLIFIIIGLAISLTIIGAIYGIPLAIIGIALIIFRKEEDKIEEIKQAKGGKNK
jgi:hypothetical protein